MHYTSAYTLGDMILYRGIEKGKRRFGEFKFQPSLFYSSKSPTKYKTIQGKYVEKMDFLSIKQAKEFVNQYKDVDNFEIFGNQSFEYSFISDRFPGEIEWNFEDILIANIDIEVASDNGFPAVETATEALQAITVRKQGKVYAFGCHSYNAPADVLYTQCNDEYDLIEQFLSFWESDYPDVITGWYVKLFDIPYLVNRITRLLGEHEVKRLSPWKQIRKREIKIMKNSSTVYMPLGISTLDYLELYKKFAPEGKSRENYKLDYICHMELGEKKLSYQEYGSLHLLYKENFQKFMDYNVQDTYLVEKLDKRLNLLRLAFKLAYHAKCNFDDVFMQTRMWDSLVCNHLLKENIILPAKQSFEKEEYVGAWVKEPIPGRYKWVVSFDFASLYPKIMMQYNLSNDTIIDQSKLKGYALGEYLEQEITIETLLNKKVDNHIILQGKTCITPNKQLYTTSHEGFLPKILRQMFNDRVRYKQEMKRCQKELEKTNDPVLKEKLENDIAMFDCFQQSIKVCINSCYGALGNQFFRLFDVRIAEAVTTAGQLAIHWVINNINTYLNKLLDTNNKDYVIAADTDSMYITLDSLVDKIYGSYSDTFKIVDFLDKVCQKNISPFIETSCQDLANYTNAFSQEMEMKREKICDVAVVIAKKRYIWNVLDNEGVRYKKPKVSIVGLETKRSNVPEWAKKKITEAINHIIADEEYKIHELMEKSEIEFMNLPVEDLGSPTGMNGLGDYIDSDTLYKKGTPAHIKGSIIYNQFLKSKGLDKKYPTIKEGEKVKYVYLKSPNPIHYDVIAFSNTLPPEFQLNKYIDRDMMFNKVLVTPVKAMLDVIGWTIKEKRGLF